MLRGRISQFWSGVFIIVPDNSIGCDCYVREADLPLDAVGLHYRFEVEIEPGGIVGMLHATHLEADENGEV